MDKAQRVSLSLSGKKDQKLMQQGEKGLGLYLDGREKGNRARYQIGAIDLMSSYATAAHRGQQHRLHVPGRFLITEKFIGVVNVPILSSTSVTGMLDSYNNQPRDGVNRSALPSHARADHNGTE